MKTGKCILEILENRDCPSNYGFLQRKKYYVPLEFQMLNISTHEVRHAFWNGGLLFILENILDRK